MHALKKEVAGTGKKERKNGRIRPRESEAPFNTCNRRGTPNYMKPLGNNGEIEFLRSEAITGLTFSRIALRSTDQEKTDRNRANARKAYDALLHFLPRVSDTSEIWEEIRTTVAELKSNLQQLGEEV